MKKLNVRLLLGSFFSLLFLLSLIHPESIVFSATANYIVISEVQIGGTTATDEFVELYNPTDIDFDLSGWRLTRKTSAGTEANLVASISGVIPAHGYFLIAHPNYDGVVTADLLYSAASNSMAAGASVILYSDAGLTVVDKMGMGIASDPETTATIDPADDSSVERKVVFNSTTESMGPGGAHEFIGNGQDTNINNDDFVSRIISQPQNAQSPIEDHPFPVTPPSLTVTPTPIPTETVTPTLVPTSTPTPTEELTPTPTAAETPTPTDTPSPTATATPTPTDTPMPTSTPTPTATVTPTTTPTITPTPTPIAKKQAIGFFRFPFEGKSLVCYQEYTRTFFGWSFPTIKCVRV